MAIFITIGVLACLLGGALVGMYLKSHLPVAHFSSESRDAVKLTMGLVTTMAAMVLGLQLGSAKSAFDVQAGEVTQLASKAIMLDSTLAYYGPPAQPARELLRSTMEQTLARIWPEECPAKSVPLDPLTPSTEIYREIRALSPTTDEQRDLKSRALTVISDIAAARWLLHTQESNTFSTPLVVVVVCWLVVIFVGCGLLAPRNGTVVASLIIGAGAVSGAIFLILELSAPFHGVIKVSAKPIAYALKVVGS